MRNDLRTLRVRVFGEHIFSNVSQPNLTDELSQIVAKHKKVIWGENHRILKVSSIERQYFVPNNGRVCFF